MKNELRGFHNKIKWTNFVWMQALWVLLKLDSIHDKGTGDLIQFHAVACREYTLLVNATPQMTCKMSVQNGYREKWWWNSTAWQQIEHLDTKWKIQKSGKSNIIFEWVTKAQRERQWQHLRLRGTARCIHHWPLPLNVSAHFLLSVSVVLSHIIRTRTVTQAQCLRLRIISMCMFICEFSSPWFSLSISCSTFRPSSSSSNTWSLWQTCTTLVTRVMDSTDKLSLLHRLWAQAPRLQRDLSRALHAAPGLATALLQQSLFCGPRLRLRYTRKHAPPSTSSASPSPSTRRLVCQSVVVSLSSSSMSDGTGRPGEQRNREAQNRTLLDKKSKCLQNAKQELVDTNSRTTMAAKVGITWSSSKKSHWDGRNKEISEFCIRHYGKTKIHRGSEHHIGTISFFFFLHSNRKDKSRGHHNTDKNAKPPSRRDLMCIPTILSCG